jgi:hypothetical protein
MIDRNASDGLETLFEAGQNDTYWCIEGDDDGGVYLTTNAETREKVTPARHRGWDAEQLRDALTRDGVPAAVVNRYMAAAGFDVDPAEGTPSGLGAAIGRAMARDVLADHMPREWTGLDPQDADRIPEGMDFDAVEAAAKAAYLGALKADDDD